MMIPKLSCTFFSLVLFLLCCSFSNSTRVPLTGDSWSISNHLNRTALGTIPGTIHTILLAAKQIPEPYFGYNDVILRDLIYSSWTFQRNFSLTSDVLASTTFTLHFDQIDTVANITLNGCFLGSTNSMFIAYTFNVMNSCLHADNSLQIVFESPVIYALDQSIAYNGTVRPNCTVETQHGECHVQFIRKEPCSFSWDWGPAFAPIGITGDVYLDGTNTSSTTARLDSINIVSFSSTDDAWKLIVDLSSDNDAFMGQFHCQLVNTSWTYDVNVTFNRTVSISLSIPSKHVLLWWPNGHGDQPLYELTVYNQQNLVGSRLIGFRTVELVQQEYGPSINGTSFYFKINSRPIFIKGSNWVPPDSFQERVNNDQLEQLLRSAQVANINMLRIWGGGIYERDQFYELADRLGIMLWHDFMFACSLYPVDDAFLMNVRKEVIYQVQRLQSHPSIVIWAGNNENEAAVAQNWYGIPVAEMDAAKNDYRKLYIDTVNVTVALMDKGSNRPFVSSSPSNGLESVKENYIAIDPQDPLYGDVHFYGYQDDSWNPETYPITRFISETGIQSMPSLDTWRQATNNTSDLDFWSSFVDHRQHAGNGQKTMMLHIQSNLPLPTTNDSLKNFTHLIYLSQIMQAITMQTISDVCRLNSPVEMIDPKTSQGNTMGLMYWQINDIWQAPTWSTIEYGLKWKMAHYYVKHMYSPVYPVARLTPYLASVTDPNARVSFHVINELVNGIQGQLICSVHSLDRFSVRLSIAYDVSMDGVGVQSVASISYTTLMRRAQCANGGECLIHCSLDNGQSQESQTLFLAPPKNYTLQQPNLRIDSIKQRSPTDIDITLTATMPALFVWLDIPAGTSGYFSRNGFHMFESNTMVTYHSWTPIDDFDRTNFDLRFTSLFDVTQP